MQKKNLLLILVGVLLLVGLRARVGAQASPQVYLNPTPLELERAGDSGSVEVVLANVSESAGFEFQVSFNQEIIQIETIDLLTPPAGVNLIPLKNINNETGVVTFGALVTCDAGVCPNILSGSPAVLATLTVSAVGEGTSNLIFDTWYILYGTEMGTDDSPVRIEAALTNGQVKVGEASDGGPTVNLSAGGNMIVWPAGLGDLTSLSALGSIVGDCSGAVGISRKKNGWWESAVYGYGGVNFTPTEGAAVYIRVESGCVWSP